MTEEQRIASWSDFPYCQRTRADEAEKQLAIMTKKFNMAKQGRDKFRKENEKLKTANRNSLLKAVLTLAPLKEENAKLKEENEELKKGLIEEHDRAERCKDRLIDLADISKGLQKDVKKLKEENEKLKDKIGDLDWSLLDAITQKDIAIEERQNGYTHHYSQNEELKKENEELKMNTHRLNCSHCNLISSEDDLFLSLDCGEFTCEGCFNEGKSKNIKKENEELEQQIADITDALWDEAVPVPRTDLILSDIHKGRQAIEENQELFQELENMKKKYICIPGEYLMDN